MRGDVVGLAATLNAAVPLPLPDAPEVSVTQDAALEAVQVQPLPPVTATLPVPAELPKLVAVGVAVKVHAEPGCVTDTTWPPTDTVPVRAVVAVFAAACRPMVPLPDPLAPDVIVSQAAALVAVQLQPPCAVTETPSDPPAALVACVAGDAV